MVRQAVHFLACGLSVKPGLRLSSLRNDADCYVVFNLGLFLAVGKDAGTSANGVVNVLGADGVEPKYFLFVYSGMQYSCLTPLQWVEQVGPPPEAPAQADASMPQEEPPAPPPAETPPTESKDSETDPPTASQEPAQAEEEAEWPEASDH